MVLERCVPWWTAQRGTGLGSLSSAETEALAEPVAYALRRSTPSQLIELITVQTRSARSLPHVVGHRLWKLIRSAQEFDRRPLRTDLPVDEHGAGYRRMIAAKAARNTGVMDRTATLRAKVRAKIRRDWIARRAALPAEPEVRPWAREDPQEHIAQAALDLWLNDPSTPPLHIYRWRAMGCPPLATFQAERQSQFP